MNKNYLPIITPIVIFLVGLGFLGYTYYKNITNKPAAISVTSKYQEADITLRGKELGKTPYEDTEVKPGTAELIMQTSNRTQNKQIMLTDQALTVVSADVGISDNFSANLIIWYDKTGSEGGDLFVSSNPSGATIKVNNKDVGETPVTITKAEVLDNADNEYNILLEKEGYETQKITVKLEDGYTLNISADLFQKPIPQKVTEIDNSEEYIIYGLIDSNLSASGGAEWAKAVAYWLETRGTAVIGSSNVSYFDYFVDSEGNLYGGNGESLDKETVSIENTPEEALIIGYLSTNGEEGITDGAKNTIAGIFSDNVEISENTANTYIVKETGVGYLNVRSAPNLDGELLGQLDIGAEVEVIELQGDWYKIVYEGGENNEAYVYATHLQVLEPEQEEEEEVTEDEDNNTEEEVDSEDENTEETSE